MDEDERFPVCVVDSRCVLLFGHEGGCVGRIGKEDSEESAESSLEVVADIAEFANGIASLVVGHRRILVEGGFDSGLADVMCQALHAKLLGLDIWDSNGISDEWPDFPQGEDDE